MLNFIYKASFIGHKKNISNKELKTIQIKTQVLDLKVILYYFNKRV